MSLKQRPVLNDSLGDVSVVVVFDERTTTGLVFNRRVGAQELTFVSAMSGVGDPLTMRDEHTGSLWSGFNGKAIAGPLKGWQLEQLPSTYAFWFVWQDYYPETAVYGEDARPKAGR
jgi:hypothetical protein